MDRDPTQPNQANSIYKPLKIAYRSSRHRDLRVAQLVERWTVIVKTKYPSVSGSIPLTERIRRAIARRPLFMPETTKAEGGARSPFVRAALLHSRLLTAAVIPLELIYVSHYQFGTFRMLLRTYIDFVQYGPCVLVCLVQLVVRPLALYAVTIIIRVTYNHSHSQSQSHHSHITVTGRRPAGWC